MTPGWHGRRYPSLEDLELAAEALGARVLHAEIGEEALFVPALPPVPPAIILPLGQGPLRTAWLLAHELGHLYQHFGPKGQAQHDREQAQANRWAACALIPEAAIRRYQNASEDAFMGALSRHYQDLPTYPCPERKLAGRIARIRLGCLQVKSKEDP